MKKKMRTLIQDCSKMVISNFGIKSSYFEKSNRIKEHLDFSIWRFNAHHQMLKSVFFAYRYHFPKENLINWSLICAMSRVIQRNFCACFCNKSLAEWIFESKIKLKKKSEICQFLKKDRDNFVNIHTISLTIKKKALILTEVGPNEKRSILFLGLNIFHPTVFFDMFIRISGRWVNRHLE